MSSLATKLNTKDIEKMLITGAFAEDRSHFQQDLVSCLWLGSAFVPQSRREKMAMPVLVTGSPKPPLLVPAAANDQDAANRAAPQNPIHESS